MVELFENANLRQPNNVNEIINRYAAIHSSLQKEIDLCDNRIETLESNDYLLVFKTRVLRKLVSSIENHSVKHCENFITKEIWSY